MTTIEQMAMAVIKGDLEMARGLALLLIDEYLLPNTRVVSAGKRLKAVVYLKDGNPTEAEMQRITTKVRQWLDDPESKIAVSPAHIDRIELFEFPEEKS
jgi:hypothetical protein